MTLKPSRRAEVAFSADNWPHAGSHIVGGSIWHDDLGFGSRILIADGGRYLSVRDTAASSEKLQLVQLGFDEGEPTADTMVGGRFDDEFWVDHEDDVVIENPNEGRDTVHTTLGRGSTLQERIANAY